MRAVFLDLNGTLVTPVKVSHPTEYTLLPGAAAAIRLLNQHGFICPVVTVQSRISKQIFSLAVLHESAALPPPTRWVWAASGGLSVNQPIVSDPALRRSG